MWRDARHKSKMRGEFAVCQTLWFAAVIFEGMQTSAQFDSSFLVSNTYPPEDGFFQGYCFVGNDLVFGREGARQYQAETGKSIPQAQDGCYVTVAQTGDSFTFDVDYSGFTILYYYHDGVNWVVSNSFSRVVDYLRQIGARIQPNYAHIAAANGRRMALGQLFSLETMARGIRVAPRTHTLIVHPHRVDFIRRVEVRQEFDDYGEALSGYLETWVSRMETLMVASDADFTVDLTGGVDSRTNFALVLAAMNRLGRKATPPRLRCSSGPGNRVDIEVAKKIATAYGLQMNDRREMQRIHLNSDQSFQVYRDQTLGVYFPFYRPTQAPTPGSITIGGGGGGLHRNTYERIIKSDDPEVFFTQHAKHLKHPEFEEEFVRDGQKFLEEVLLPGEDPLRVLLREGRVRYHSGRTPRNEVAFTPLHSVSADFVQSIAGDERLDSGQLNYDIMYSIDPKLMVMPYDSVEKEPSSDVKNNLVGALLSKEANPGRVWSADTISNDQSDGNEVWSYARAFDVAVSNRFVSNFWGSKVLAEANSLMETLKKGESIGNAANGVPIAAILSADLVTPN